MFSSAALVAIVIAIIAGWIEVITESGRRPASEVPTDSAAPSRRAAWATAAGVALVAALVVQTWFRNGTQIAEGDHGPVAGVAWLSRLFEPWSWSGATVGSPGTLELNLPWAVVLGAVHAAGGSAVLAQRIWYTTLIAGAALAVVFLLQVLGIRPLPACCGAAVYLVNAYVVTWVGTNLVFISALLLLPALPAVVIAVATRRIRLRTLVVIFAVMAPLCGYVFQNPPLLGLVLVATICSPALAWLIGGAAAGRRGLGGLGLGMTVLLLVSAYWLLPAGIQSGAAAGAALKNLASWSFTESRATIANALWLNTHWGWQFPEYYPYAPGFDRLPLSLLKFLLPALAFSALTLQWPGMTARPQGRVRRTRLPIVLVAASVAVLEIILSTGTRPPGAYVFDFLYELPFGWLLREPGRFLLLTALAYAVLVSLGVEALLRRSPRPRTDWYRAVKPGFAAVGVAIVTLSGGYPVVVGAVAPDARPVLPSAHVRLPDYWVQMGRLIDQVPEPGAVLVLPPDDFYQTGYSWGYYGVDAFIPELFRRPALLPTPQSYFTVNGEVLGAVDLFAKSILSHNWVEADRLLSVLGTPFVLVRGDVIASPGRSNLLPGGLSTALFHAPDFTLVHQAGPLQLFRANSAVPARVQTATQFITVSTDRPDLRLLAALDPGTHLVTSPPTPGVPLALFAPPVTQWTDTGTSLETTVAEPAGWDFTPTQMGPAAVAPATLPLPDARDPAPRVRVEQRRGPGSSQAHLTIPLDPHAGAQLLDAGGWGDVRDCHALLADAARADLHALVLAGAGPGGAAAIRLSASADSACVIHSVPFDGSPLMVSLNVNHVQGANPRLCLWQAGADTCARIPDLPIGKGWLPYRAVIEPELATTSLVLFLYADSQSAHTPTVNEYSDVRFSSLSGLPSVVLVGHPQTSATPPRSLTVLHESYSRSWVGPTGSTHVLVDGMFNGWIGRDSSAGADVHYGPAPLITAGLWISGVSLFLVLAAAFLSRMYDRA